MYKIPEFYTIFARKMPEFYIIIARKIFSRILGGTPPPALRHVPPCPPPVSYAYGFHWDMILSGTWPSQMHDMEKSLQTSGRTVVPVVPFAAYRLRHWCEV